MKILYFSAIWCGPCSVMKPIIEDLSKMIKIEKIDVDNSHDDVKKYGIRNIPTFVLVDDKEIEINRTAGIQTKKELMKFAKLADL